jgi:large subunit ribosomal protein L9
MRVILTKDVAGIGRAGDVKEVSDGHARNFLIPRHLALPATTEALTKIQKEEGEHQAKVAKEKERFIQLKNKLENKSVTLRAQASKNHLFAAIHEKEIAKAIFEKLGVEVSPDIIKLKNQVKSLGQHEVEIRFAKDMSAVVRLNVESI